MDRIDGPTAVDIGGGRMGFRGKDTVAGVPGTAVRAKWLNAFQEEAVGFVEKTGQEPSYDDLNQLAAGVQSGALNFAAATGTANAWEIDPALAIGAYKLGRVLYVKPPATNTSSAVTVTVSGLPARSVKKADGTNPKPGDLRVDRWYPMFDDGAGLRALSMLPSDLSRAGRTQVFTASGTFVVPDGINCCHVRTIGGGGGGGSSPAVANNLGGGGGSSGGYAEKWCEVAPGQSIAATVGGAGPAGIGGNSGGNGGTSSFGAFCSATGGGGGNWNGNTNAIGGVGAGGDVNLYGSGGQQGTKDGTAPIGGGGGNPPFGGGATSASYAAGYAAQGYGAGGGGGGGTGNNGGAGAPGLVIVEW